MGRIVIIGAGPCGLACARELDRLGHRDWLLLERHAWPGGLARSVVDSAGFTWDLGGHVVFSTYGEFDELLRESMGDELLYHERASYVRFEDRWIPYPFQNNLHRLPQDVAVECLRGLASARGGTPDMNFEDWILATFGSGIRRHFMDPYNRKVWAFPLSDMAATWIAERVSVVDYDRAAANVRDKRDDTGWGPNNQFAFPATGGTGEVFSRLASRLGDRIRYGAEVVQVDTEERVVRTSDGDSWEYAAIVSSMPLDRLVAALAGAPDGLHRAAGNLVHNSVIMAGVGYELPLSDNRSWMYFPSAAVPFYRVTNFAKYSPANVPRGDTARFSSYMTETAYSAWLPFDRRGIAGLTETALREAGVVKGSPRVASLHVEDIDYAYPVPTLGRDKALATIQAWLMEQRIYSRGRFGAWRYEAGNMDHAVKMGIDAARLLIRGTPEELWTLK